VSTINFSLFSSISPSKVDSYNVLVVVCLGGIFVFEACDFNWIPKFSLEVAKSIVHNPNECFRHCVKGLASSIQIHDALQ